MRHLSPNRHTWDDLSIYRPVHFFFKFTVISIQKGNTEGPLIYVLVSLPHFLHLKSLSNFVIFFLDRFESVQSESNLLYCETKHDHGVPGEKKIHISGDVYLCGQSKCAATSCFRVK